MSRADPAPHDPPETAMPRWTLAMPLVAAAMLVCQPWVPMHGLWVVFGGLGLMGAVLAAVHHAEVVAHRVGEPFGTLVLALAITVIEVALIVSLMLAGGAATTALARDTVYATLMIITTGVVGLCVMAGGVAHREQAFRVEGAAAGLGALLALAVLVLVLPSFTTSTAGPTYSTSQLVFAALASLVLWGLYVFVQTVRHRDYFLPADAPDDAEAHAHPPSARTALLAFVLLMVALVSVVGLAKALSPLIERAVDAAGAPKAVVGIAIAMLVLAPETLAALRAARANRLQTSLNLALGSALASIGLTIPAVVAVSVFMGLPLTLGLEPKDIVLMTLAFLLCAVTLGHGRTNVMQGGVHLVVFAAFLFLSLVP